MGDAEREEEERDREEDRRVAHDRVLRRVLAAHVRQHLEPGTRVLLATEERDRVEVRELPEEEDREEHQAAAPSTRFVAAVQPRSGGIAPGIAPTSSARCERCFSGV